MAHHHHHHHHPHLSSGSVCRVFVFAIAFNLLFVGIEAFVGIWQHSLSLLSDAGHNLGDVFSLVLVVVGFRLAKVRANARYTYGLRKSTVLISLLNAIILLVAVGAIVIESIRKLSDATPVNGEAVTWTAAAGILVNGITTALLMKSQQHDLNVRGAFLHMLADTLVSVGVVLSGVAITCTSCDIIDPIVSLAIAAVILVSTWRLLGDSLRLSLDGMPEGITISQTSQVMRANSHVTDVHHIHVWAVSTTENALTAHVVIDDLSLMDEVKSDLKRRLSEIGICHTTLEFETVCCGCECRWYD